VFEGNALVNEYVGGYDDWLRQSQDRDKKESNTAAKNTSDNKPVAVAKADKPKKLTYKDQRELDALPAQIEDFENEVEKLQNLMADEAFYKQEKDEILKVQKKLEEVQAGLAHCYTRWEVLEQ